MIPQVWLNRQHQVAEVRVPISKTSISNDTSRMHEIQYSCLVYINSKASYRIHKGQREAASKHRPTSKTTITERTKKPQSQNGQPAALLAATAASAAPASGTTVLAVLSLKFFKNGTKSVPPVPLTPSFSSSVPGTAPYPISPPAFRA